MESQLQSSHSETKFSETTPYQANCHSKQVACFTMFILPERRESTIKPISCIRAQQIVLICNKTGRATNTASELDASH
jgi:hypothetical protein